MNRVLSWPHTPIVPGLLEALKEERQRTAVTDKGMIRFDLFLGPVEMKFSRHDHAVEPGTEVYVWWKGGGFVCAPATEVDAEEEAARQVVDRVHQARLALAEARRERREKLLANIDIVISGDLPDAQPEQHAPA